jgi:hypothetical protein
MVASGDEWQAFVALMAATSSTLAATESQALKNPVPLLRNLP